MHEAMEQQTISISKAGINASLRTRCAVLAAANPKAGRFQPFLRFLYRTNQSAPPLISRFDVIWLLTDEPSEDKDAKIAGTLSITDSPERVNSWSMKGQDPIHESLVR